MTNNKKLASVLVLFVLLPFVVASVNNYLGDNKHIEFSYDNRWTIAMSMYLISFFSSIFLLKKSEGSEQKKFWKFIAIAGIIVFGLLSYLAYSFSNFGF